MLAITCRNWRAAASRSPSFQKVRPELKRAVALLGLIVLAAVAIIWAAVGKWLHGLEIERLIETGVRQEGYYELLKGLQPGERVEMPVMPSSGPA